ncbi:MAG: Flp pilus assembly protein CpaB [Bryobacterales bacterium]|nr:Flp pilus assembly protein CpaB [Bryobacterales bacterium]
MDRQKLLLIFGGAFIAATLLTWFLYSQTVAPKKDKMVTVLAATADLPAGTRVQKVHLKKIAIPQATAPRGTVAEEAQALERALLFPVTMNEPILSNRLSSVTGADGVASLIEPGKRGVSVSVADAASAGGLIQPRAHVDVLFTKTGSMAEAVTSTVLEDVVVLSIGRNVEAAAVAATGTAAPAAAPSTGNRSVTLLVTPEQARVLELAKNQGKISLALRNPKDAVKSEEVLSATSETIDPGLMLRTAKARAMATGRMPSRAAMNIPNLQDDKAWAALVGEDPAQRPPSPVTMTRPAVEKKEPPKPRAVIDVFRGDKHVQETFQD